MSDVMDRPTDNLVRQLAFDPNLMELREADEGDDVEKGMTGETLTGHFATFNEWTEIDSYWEGRFLERIAPGAFTETFEEHERTGRVKVLYDHGHDPSLGNKPLGPIDVLEEDKTGARYEVPLIDAEYNTGFIIPASRKSLLGASFRFRATAEQWVTPKEASDHNPQKLDERTIEGIDLYEFGPVTFPAYAGATAGLRSGTDRWMETLRTNPRLIADLTERLGPNIASEILESLSAAPVGPAAKRKSAPVGPDPRLELQLALQRQRALRKV